MMMPGIGIPQEPALRMPLTGVKVPVGEVSVMMAVGLEMEWSDTGSGMFALMIFKGEAELLGGIIVRDQARGVYE